MGWVSLVLTCIGYGFALALMPAALVYVLIEHYQPPPVVRVAAWTMVGAIFLTPLAAGVVAMLTP